MQLLILYAALAVGISFLCSISEAVLLSVTPSYIAFLEQRGTRGGRTLARLKRNVDRPLSAILALNTIANTAGAALVGAQATVVFGSRSLGVVSGVLTLLILVFSEILPKTIGSLHWRQLAPAVGCGVQGLQHALLPFVLLSDLLTRLVSRGRGPGVFHRDEFHALALLGGELGHLKPRETQVLANLLHFRSHCVREIMTPRTVVFGLPEHVTVGQVMEHYRELPFSRIPVFTEALDDSLAFVLRADILLHQARRKTGVRLGDLKRALRAVPSSNSLFDTLELLLEHQEHIALVVDEYGGMDGIVTLEDVVETLVGLEIVDEKDVAVDMQALARERWRRHADRLGVDAETFTGQDGD